jgi:hypothetical protein
MAAELKRDYRYLDGEAERLALIEDIKQVRRDVLRVADLVPKDKHHEPRYHGWSLGAMLGHLQLMDNLSMWVIELGILGVRVPVSAPLVDSFNDWMAGIYRGRVVETTIRGIQKKEKGIEEFVMRVPVDKFTRLVYHPILQVDLTVEQALQEVFLYHWREHLETMRKVDDMHYEPPTGNTPI